MAATVDVDEVMDKFAVTDVMVKYFELVNTKEWDRMDEVLLENATCQETADRVLEGRARIVTSMKAFEDSDEIVLHDHPGSFIPVISGDSADVKVRVRSMHYGAGARQGKFYESLAIMVAQFARTADGWRMKHYDWQIQVRRGDLGDLYAPELERMGRRIGASGGSVPADA